MLQARVKELLNYNSKTGIFTRKISRGRGDRFKKGTIPGYTDKDGYKIITIDDKEYKAHRLAWLYVYGYIPEGLIEHKDQTKYHNWIDNLRETSQQCNIRNTGNRKNNKSGVKGVYWNKRDKKWTAQIMINKQTKCMGNFSDFDEAVCHRLAAEQCLDWANCDSNSPAYQYVKEMLKKEIV